MLFLDGVVAEEQFNVRNVLLVERSNQGHKRLYCMVLLSFQGRVFDLKFVGEGNVCPV